MSVRRPGQGKGLPDHRAQTTRGGLGQCQFGVRPSLDGVETGRPQQRDADGRRGLLGDRRPRAAGQPEADHPPTLDEQAERRRGDVAAHPVEHQIHSPDGVVDPLGPVNAAVVDHDVGTQRRGQAELV